MIAPMPSNPLNPSFFKKPALVLAVAAICGLGLAGCNDDDDVVFNPAPTTPTPVPTGDLIALTESGQIASVNRSAPNVLVSTQKIIGLQAGDSVVGIDYRPANGKLYGVGAKGNIYTIEPTTGVVTSVINLRNADNTAPFSGITGNPSQMAVDFNPAADRLRVVGNDGQNLRINVDTGATIVDGAINGATGAVITSVAYTNSFAGAISTRMINIDVGQDRLYLQDPPNNGTLSSTVFAPLGVDATSSSGFDIDGLNNMAYAALKVGGTVQLYSINLAALGTTTVAATLPANVNTTLPTSLGDVRGIALKSATNPVASVQGLSANNQLVSFNPTAPSITTTKAITGLMAGETVVGIDARVNTIMAGKSGLLYGLTNLGNLYTIDTSTGEATGKLPLTADSVDTTAPFIGLVGTAFGVDFNPTVDRLRVVSNTGQNLRIDVDKGFVTTDKAIDLAGSTPSISGIAYTNSFSGASSATGTKLYDLDSTSNNLYEQIPPNEGVLVLKGATGLTLVSSTGMDIAGGDNMVLAVNGNSLYRINLSSGAATPAVSVAGVANLEASRIGGTTTPALIDLAILLK